MKSRSGARPFYTGDATSSGPARDLGAADSPIAGHANQFMQIYSNYPGPSAAPTPPPKWNGSSGRLRHYCGDPDRPRRLNRNCGTAAKGPQSTQDRRERRRTRILRRRRDGWDGDRPGQEPASSVTNPAHGPKEAPQFRRRGPRASRLPDPAVGSHSAAQGSYY